MKRLFLAAFMVGAIALPAPAQPAHGDRPKLDEKTLAAARDLGNTVLGWVRSEVLPVATGWKQQLDGAMSAEDLRALNALRARATSLRERAVKLGATMRDAWRSEDYTTLKKTRADLKKVGEERQALMKELKPLAEKYRTTLQSIGQTARPKIQEWGKHIKQLGQQWWQAHKAELDPQTARAIGNLMSQRKDMMAMFGPEMRQKVAVARFMLWDGSDFTREIQQALDRGDFGNGGPSLD